MPVPTIPFHRGVPPLEHRPGCGAGLKQRIWDRYLGRWLERHQSGAGSPWTLSCRSPWLARRWTGARSRSGIFAAALIAVSRQRSSAADSSSPTWHQLRVRSACVSGLAARPFQVGHPADGHRGIAGRPVDGRLTARRKTLKQLGAGYVFQSLGTSAFVLPHSATCLDPA